ncbi:hypothetical protein [Pseudomonas sp. GOM6]|uniref:hypothetical protein n=1 Tax=Pseudomonas sp. GOM6 TaxID=3036944 RepID=UPI00240A173F|nr:hypothetical protein [Pseudomonas sp. GOM6]MDG1581086.1 hypothetical protein [Pseudomonas sp. GOM6]
MNSMLKSPNAASAGLTGNNSGLKLSVVEDVLFESTLRSPAMGVVEFGPNMPALHRLRVKDRLFAACNSHADHVAWLEVIEVLPAGYRAIVLKGEGGWPEVELDLSGVGLFDGSPFIVEAIDDGLRFLPTERSSAVSSYMVFRELGITTSLDFFHANGRPGTNQVHFNAGEQAILSLTLGQYFVAGGKFWIVREEVGSGYVAHRLCDDMVAHFSPSGHCVDLAAQVECVVLGESDFDLPGWDYEHWSLLASGLPRYDLFDIQPGALKRAQVGQRVMLHAAGQAPITSWEVLHVSATELLINNGDALGTLSIRTGAGGGAAAGASFMAVALATPWSRSDLVAMAQKLLSRL